MFSELALLIICCILGRLEDNQYFRRKDEKEDQYNRGEFGCVFNC